MGVAESRGHDGIELKFQVPSVRSDAIENALKPRCRRAHTAAGAILRHQRRSFGGGRADPAAASGRRAVGTDGEAAGPTRVRALGAQRAGGLSQREAGSWLARRPPDRRCAAQRACGIGRRETASRLRDRRGAVGSTFETADTSVEVAFDRGQIRAGTQAMPVMELEFELVNGNRAALVEPRPALVRKAWLVARPPDESRRRTPAV